MHYLVECAVSEIRRQVLGWFDYIRYTTRNDKNAVYVRELVPCGVISSLSWIDMGLDS